MLQLGMSEHVVRQISGHSPDSKEFHRYVKIAQCWQDSEAERVHKIIYQNEQSLFHAVRENGVVTEIGSSANVVGTNADQVTNFTVKVRITAQSYIDLLKKNAENHSPFRPGLTATVDIQTSHVKALSVPIQSVTTRDEKKADAKANQKDDSKKSTIGKAPSKEYVFVFQAGKVKQVEVTTGIQDDTYIQILSGLKGGEEVVSAPFAAISKTLKDGMIVQKVDKSKLFSGDAKKE